MGKMAEEMIKLADVEPNFTKYDHVCADTETTGLGKHDEIVEITMTEYNMDGEIGETISYLCEPISGKIPIGASKVHGIYIEDVLGCPTYTLGGVRMDCATFLEGRKLSAHNASFDIRMMRIKIDEKRIVDTLKLARKKWPTGKNNLKACIKKIGREWDDSQAHRASYDVEKCIELHLYLTNGDDRRPTFL